MGGPVFVATIGSCPVQNTILAMGFHMDMLETSCVVEHNVGMVPAESFTVSMLSVFGMNL
jgi:hypothetical protein